MPRGRLGVGFIGSGFITRFHIKSWIAVRDADVRGVWSPHAGHAEEAAALARSLRVGEARAFASIEEMVAAPEIDCIWICGPNQARLENMERIVDALGRGAKLVGIACEKPLARNGAEARRMVELAEKAGVLHGYLESQLFSPVLERGREIVWARGAALSGRPYLARAAEEHSGPHMPWFWRGDLQGGGVLLDMLCHSIEVGRHLLTPPGAPRNTLRPIKVSAQTASLKWSRPEYAKLLTEMMGAEVDYQKAPSEDFARATIQYLDEKGQKVMTESTTSWSYVGAGLRLSLELLGPEYSMSANSLDAGGRVFFSRRLQGAAGEDLVEKQNAEQGLMPVVGSETAEYGYEGENRFFTQSFADGQQPWLDFHAGLDVTRLLMACYMSAEQERVIAYPPRDLDAFVPAVARGTWKPCARRGYSRRMRGCGISARLSAWTAAGLCALASSGAAAPPASKHVQPELVADVESIAAGRPFQAGLRLRMDPEWHTYWKNPGDSGLATRLLWKLPEGFQAGPIEWPYPEVFKQGPVTSYGYTNEVLLPVTITPPATLAAGTSVTLAARADWLECREACLPGRRELSLVLPVRGEAARASTQAAAFEAARARLPQPGAGWAFEARETPDKVVLVVRPPRGQAAIQKATFFPDRGQLIDHAAAQAWTRAAGATSGYRLEMTPAPNAARPLGALEGVLVTEGSSGATVAVRVQANSTKEKP